MAEPTPPKAPGMGEMFEQALHALISPSVFKTAAARPAPSFGASALLALASGAAAMGANLAHAAVQSPDLFSRFTPPIIVAVGFAALGLYGSMVLLMAVMLYGIGNALGGKGEFDRGMQAAAMLSIVFPVQMLCNWFPLAWVLPAAIGAWLAAGALEGLFGAKPAAARALCAVLAAGAIGLQAAGRMLADRARQYAASQIMAQVQAPMPASETTPDPAQLMQQMQALQQQAATSAPAPATSSLDLLKGPADADMGQAPAENAAAPTAQEAVAASAKGMQTSALGMLDAMAPMLNNPAMTKNMNPQQKAAMKELQDVMADLKTQIQSGHSLSDPAFAQKMARVQKLSLALMAAGMQAPAAGAGPAPGGQKHLQFDQGSK